jgi:bifunctional non-homologous end joining protein LigD
MSSFQIEGRDIHLSNLEKVLYPGIGFTKAQVIDFYIRISPVLLPHLKDRPITMKRYPDGVEAEYFYEKQAPKHTPKWVNTAAVWSRGKKDKIDYILINDLPSLVWSANLANLELHTFLGCAPAVEIPTMVVFDLDPGPPADVIQCAQVAVWIRDVLGALNLECYPKTSGSKGMQLYVPLNTNSTYEVTRPFANVIAEYLEQQHPETVVSTVSKEIRTGKVFIDWSQNAQHKTTICVYSLRAREKPYVSMPVRWEELEAALKKGDPERLYFLPEQALDRMESFGDLFEPLLKQKQQIPADFTDKIRGAAPKSARSIAVYRAKRDFSRTREPAPRVPVSAEKDKEPMFVIQKHEASRLHYDFRLEMQGVLRSWAVPKGIPTTRLDRRMAVHVEDHPMDYAKFEGTIPPDNYGAGTVMVWDMGTYSNKDDDPVRGYYAGKLHLVLKGKKLNGEWVLVRIGRDKSEENKNWLLMKAGTDAKPISVREDDRSVLTSRTMKQIAKDNDAQWISGRKAERSGTRKWKPSARPEVPESVSALPQSEPKYLEPMQCKPVQELPKGNGWIYEVKFDGYRAVALKNGSEARLISRNEKDLGRKYPEILDGIAEIPFEKIALDGEIVAVNEHGVPSFQLLQNLPSKGERSICFYAFDLLNFAGHDTTKLPLAERKNLLASIVRQTGGILLFSAGLDADPEVVLREIRKRGLEGVIAKKKDSRYEPGKRSGAWVKFKTEAAQEFLIAGYKPSGKKNDFDLLLIGYYRDGKLLYAGKLRAGFTPHAKKAIASEFGGLVTKRLPFANLPEPAEGRWGQGITEEDLGKYVWLKPKLVCEVQFVEWTAEGHLRHPKFVALRDDKDARQVIRETSKRLPGGQT